MIRKNSIIRTETTSHRSSQTYIVVTAFLTLLALVGFAYYGLPFFYDFMAGEYGWSREIGRASGRERV